MTSRCRQFATVTREPYPPPCQAVSSEMVNAPSGTKGGTDINRRSVVTQTSHHETGLAVVRLRWEGRCNGAASGRVLGSLNSSPGSGRNDVSIPWEVIFNTVDGNVTGPIGSKRGGGLWWTLTVPSGRDSHLSEPNATRIR